MAAETAAAKTTASTRRAAPLPPEQRRAEIIEAVLPLLMERGAAITTREIASAAGVSEGTIFNVFTDKQELLAAALATAMDQAPLEQAISRIDPAEPFERRLTIAAELIQRRIVDLWRLVSRLGPHHPPSRPRPLPDIAALVSLLGTEPDRLRVDPADAARLLRALVLSFSHPMLTAEPKPVAEIVDVFLRGVEARP